MDLLSQHTAESASQWLPSTDSCLEARERAVVCVPWPAFGTAETQAPHLGFFENP